MDKQTCRHCGESFVPKPGKPGRINECEPCLREREAPKVRIIDEEKERLKEKATKKARKQVRRAHEKTIGRKVSDSEFEEYWNQDDKTNTRIGRYPRS